MSIAAAAPQEARSTHPVDLHVGRQLRRRRKALDLSQSALADALGLTFQQVQKYERGANRISASKLYAAAHFLKTNTAFFFEGLPQADDTGEAAADLEPFMALADAPGGAELARHFGQLDTHARKLVANLAATLANNSGSRGAVQ